MPDRPEPMVITSAEDLGLTEEEYNQVMEYVRKGLRSCPKDLREYIQTGLPQIRLNSWPYEMDFVLLIADFVRGTSALTGVSTDKVVKAPRQLLSYWEGANGLHISRA